MIGASVQRPAEIAVLPGLRELQTLLWIVDKKAEISTLLDQVEAARVAANKALADQYEKVAASALARMAEADALLTEARASADGLLATARDQAAALGKQAADHEAKCDAARQRLERLTTEKEAALDAREKAVAQREAAAGKAEAALRIREQDAVRSAAELAEKWDKLRAAIG